MPQLSIESKMRSRFLIVMTGLPLFLGSCPDILGVSTHANMSEIKAAFRREALIWHPDRNMDDPSASERFVAISNCYDQLTNSKKEPPSPPSQTFHASFAFKMSGTSQSTSTVIRNGKKITTTIKRDLGSGTEERSVIEEDLTTGTIRKLNHHELYIYPY